MPKQWHVGSLEEMDSKDAAEITIGDTVHYTDEDGNRIVAECTFVDGDSGAVQWRELECDDEQEDDDGDSDWL